MMNKPKYKTIIQTKLICYYGDLSGFQNEINEFARGHHVIGIKYQSYPVDSIYGTKAMDRALIMYKVRVEVEDE